MGLGSGRGPGLPGERSQANAEAALTLAPRLLFQVLLHVLFEHAVGYALLALKEVEEISLLLPQVSGRGGLARPRRSPSGSAGPSMHRALPRGRPRVGGVRCAQQLKSRGSLPAFVIRIVLEAFKSKSPAFEFVCTLYKMQIFIFA